MRDYLDTRDLEKEFLELEEIKNRIDECSEEIRVIETKVDADEEDFYDELQSLRNEIEALDAEFDEDEYNALIEMKNDVPEWYDGNTLIADNCFTEYALEMLQDCGDLPQNIPWYIEIDEEKTAENIKYDYSCIEYNGIEYWYRNC